MKFTQLMFYYTVYYDRFVISHYSRLCEVSIPVYVVCIIHAKTLM